MQFIVNGPDIPDALLQQHEEGRVVFFCGAGISRPAGLPDFGGLVEQIYQSLGTPHFPREETAFNNKQYDTMLDLLERRLPGQRQAVRQALARALIPKLRRKGAMDTHAALLQLSRTREGSLRLVTTNFDRVFHAAAKRIRRPFHEYSAPMLPIPKSSRWDGLVYLHGLLPQKMNETALSQLVVTSGDFGLAYLTERWASRFVSELFRSYTVCFIGYSINDPMLRYTMDALAADRMLGEVTPQAWILSDYTSANRKNTIAEWEAKGVTPILYEQHGGKQGHSMLHQTLRSWAETYRDGILGKERIVVNHALARPTNSTPQDDYVGQMLWALSDQSGLPAQRFAEFNPAPSLDWLLYAFSNECYRHTDLLRFGVSPHGEAKNQLRFSLIRRPAPYTLTPQMALVSENMPNTQWDRVMEHLARWLVRHLNDPQLLLWIAQRCGRLDDRWRDIIEDRLELFARLKREGNTSELSEIHNHASNAIPDDQMQALWRVLLCGRVKSSANDLEIYTWKDQFKRDGLTASLRLKLRELLAPKIRLIEPFYWSDETIASDPTNHKQSVGWELVLHSDHIHSILHDISNADWNNALPLLLNEFQHLLRDALDLQRELSKDDACSDQSFCDLPSIVPHWQNRNINEWVVLIELLRDAWLVVYEDNPAQATQIAQSWFELPYPTFKRLAFFGASKNDCIAPMQWIEWLLADEAFWLWSWHTQREVCRLLVSQGNRLAPPALRQLESAILNGPSCEYFQGDLDSEDWKYRIERWIWLRLVTLQKSGLALGVKAMEYLNTLSMHRAWELADNQCDEFSNWSIGTGDPGYEEHRRVDNTLPKGDELIQLIKQAPFSVDSIWNEVCRTHPLRSFMALKTLAREELWPTKRWQEALNAWRKQAPGLRRRQYAIPPVAKLLQRMPDGELLKIVRNVTPWLATVLNSNHQHENIVLDMCRRVLALLLKADTGMRRNGEPLNEPVTEAINHPIGDVTQALLDLWFKRKPNDNDHLPPDIEPFFTDICDIRVGRFRHGRVLLGANVIALFRVDRTWTEQNLLPLFDWKCSLEEAQGVWEGFLLSPRIYEPLLIALKPQFLETAQHYEALGRHARPFAEFLTYTALTFIEGYTFKDFRPCLEALPQEGLQHSARALAQALEGAGEQREEYWKNRVQPFWHHAWPKSLALVSPQLTEPLTRVSIAAGAEFPRALLAIEGWLYPLQFPHATVKRLHQAGHCIHFPEDSLRLLGAITNDQSRVSNELRECLNVILQAKPELSTDDRYKQLVFRCRRCGC